MVSLMVPLVPFLFAARIVSMLDLFAAKGVMLECLHELVDILSLAFYGAECGFPPRLHRKRHNESPISFHLLRAGVRADLMDGFDLLHE
jgi:hypothetical protein